MQGNSVTHLRKLNALNLMPISYFTLTYILYTHNVHVVIHQAGIIVDCILNENEPWHWALKIHQSFRPHMDEHVYPGFAQCLLAWIFFYYDTTKLPVHVSRDETETCNSYLTSRSRTLYDLLPAWTPGFDSLKPHFLHRLLVTWFQGSDLIHPFY